jgi:hypothetical protein
LGLIALGSFFVFAACSDDDDDVGGPNAAGETGAAGAPSQGGGGSTSLPEGGAHDGGATHGDGSLECQVLGELCHAADSGSGAAHDCHEVGHVGHADDCTAQFASCVGICTETDVGAGGAGGGADAKCAALGSLCHEAGEIDADASACHELGHEGNAAACADGFDACATLCLAVLEQAEAGEGGAGGGGAANTGAASGGAGGAQ